MYLLEFEYNLDRDDLSYIWQNLAPRESKKATFSNSSTGHYIMDTELLNASIIAGGPEGWMGEDWYSPPELRWMVFKVKQRAKANYSDLIPKQVQRSTPGGGSTVLSSIPGIGAVPVLDTARAVDSIRSAVDGTPRPAGTITVPPPSFEDQYQHNWPYDYLSFVEMVKIDANVQFNKELPALTTTADTSVTESDLGAPDLVGSYGGYGATGTTAPASSMTDMSSLRVSELGAAASVPQTSDFVRSAGPATTPFIRTAVDTVRFVDRGPGPDYDPSSGY